MNKDNAKDYLPLVQALAEGKTIERRIDGQKWIEDNEGETLFVAAPSCYRIKPSPSYRAWTFEEVPVGAVVAAKDKSCKGIITGVAVYSDGTMDIYFGGGHDEASDILANYTLLDGQPCGVAV